MANDEIAIFTTSKRVKLEEVMAIAEACNRQMAEHVAPSWGVAYRPVNVYSDPGKLPPGQTDICTLQDEPGEPGVLGFHSAAGVVPFAKIFASPVLDNGGVVLGEAEDHQIPSLAGVFSHEFTELTVDPGCDQYALDDHGREVDLEPGDPFQRQQYPMLVTMPWGDELVALSDFALPAWFKVKAPRPYNWMSGTAEFSGTGPFVISPGGYAMVSGDPVFASRSDGTAIHPPAWYLAMRPPGRRRMSKPSGKRRLYVGR